MAPVRLQASIDRQGRLVLVPSKYEPQLIPAWKRSRRLAIRRDEKRADFRPKKVIDT